MYKILIVEDEIGTARPVKEALELCGYEVNITSDRESELEMLEQNGHDLILLDLKMSGLAANELLRKIREKDPYSYVLIYSNCLDFYTIKGMVNIGIDGYVDKGWEDPDIKLRELVGLIKDKLEGARHEE